MLQTQVDYLHTVLLLESFMLANQLLPQCNAWQIMHFRITGVCRAHPTELAQDAARSVDAWWI